MKQTIQDSQTTKIDIELSVEDIIEYLVSKGIKIENLHGVTMHFLSEDRDEYDFNEGKLTIHIENTTYSEPQLIEK